MRSRLIVSFVLIAFCVMTCPAMADMSVRMDTTNGGSPYLATVTALSNPILGHNPGDVFPTFCLEESEYFSPGHVYNVTLDMFAVRGGIDLDPTTPGKDYLDIATAWVYSQFLDGGLSSSLNAAEVQNTIWCIEDEKAYSTLNADEKALYNQARSASELWGTDFHGVQVMNLYGDYNPAQSQLVRAVAPVPAPAALLLGLIGLGATAWLKKRA